MAGAGAKRALVILAAGAEEMEVVDTVDVLRVGGVDVTVAGLTGPDLVQCSHQVVIKPDTSLDDALKRSPYDAIILPGGVEAAQSLAASAKVGAALKAHASSGRLVAAICHGTISIPANGIFPGKKLTSHFTVKDKFSGYQYLDERVVQDGNLITSQGPGTSMEFGMKLVELLQGKEKVNEIVKPLYFKG